MAGLQRSALSFRRQGSSGLVWDDKFLAQISKLHQEDLEKAAELIKTTKSDTARSPDRTNLAHQASNVVDPPPPRAPACCFCGVFGRSRARRGDNSGKK